MSNYSLLCYENGTLVTLTCNVTKKEAEKERDDVYLPMFGGEYIIHPTSLIFNHRGIEFKKLRRGGDCVLKHGERVRFGTVEEIKSDIDSILDNGNLPPKGNIF